MVKLLSFDEFRQLRALVLSRGQNFSGDRQALFEGSQPAKISENILNAPCFEFLTKNEITG